MTTATTTTSSSSSSSSSSAQPTQAVDVPSLLHDVVLKGQNSSRLQNNILSLAPLHKLMHNCRTLMEMASHLCSDAIRVSKKEAKAADKATKTASKGMNDLLSLDQKSQVKALTRDDTNKFDKRSENVRQAGCRIHAWIGLAYLLCPEKFPAEFSKQHMSIIQKFFPDSTHDKTGLLSHMIKLSIIAYSRTLYMTFMGAEMQAQFLGSISKSAMKKLEKSANVVQQEKQSIQMMGEIARDFSSERFRKDSEGTFTRMLRQFFVNDDELIVEDSSEPGTVENENGLEESDSHGQKRDDVITCNIADKLFSLYKMDNELNFDAVLASSLSMIVSYLDKSEAEKYHEVKVCDVMLDKVSDLESRIADALHVDPNQPVALVKLGYHLMLRGQFREACNVLLKYVTVARPGDARFYVLYLAGECYVKAKVNQMSEGLLLPNVDDIPECKVEVVKRRDERNAKREAKNLIPPVMGGEYITVDEVDLFLVLGKYLEEEFKTEHKEAKIKVPKELFEDLEARHNLEDVHDALGQREGILDEQELLSASRSKKVKKREKKDAKKNAKKEKKDAKKQRKDAKKKQKAAAAVVVPSRDVPCCNKCGAEEGGEKKLNRCGRCQGILYCSRACQVADWSQHKLECKIAQWLTMTVKGEEYRIAIPTNMGLHSLVLQFNDALSQ